MKLQTIREGLAAALGYLVRDPSVFAYDPESRTGHNITIIPASEYMIPDTIGPNWEASLFYDLRIEVPGRLKDSQIAMDDYLSTGSGSTSSVIDAVLTATLPGVESSRLIGVDGPDLTADPLTAVVHFQFMVARG